VHGSTGGFAMKRPMAEDHRLDQRAPCPPHPGLTASIHGRGCEWHTWKPPGFEPAG
jgi:hypothetical protein